MKTSFEGYLVHTDKGLRVFSDSALLSVSVPWTIDVVDPGNRVTDKASSAFRSRLKFCQDGEGNIVWAEYIWKAAISSKDKWVSCQAL